MGFDESRFAVLLGAYLVNYLERHDLGAVVGADGMVKFFPGLVRIPDGAFISWGRCPKRNRRRGEIPQVVPDLVVEVLSKGNTAQGNGASSTSISAPAFVWCGMSIPRTGAFGFTPRRTSRCCSRKIRNSMAATCCLGFRFRFASGSGQPSGRAALRTRREMKSRKEVVERNRRQRLERRTERGLGGKLQPAVQHGGIDPAKIDRMLGVVVFQMSQVGVWPVQAPLDGTSDQEHRRCRAVVGARRWRFRAADGRTRRRSARSPDRRRRNGRSRS